MVQRRYKQLNCRDLGRDCNFLVRAEKEEEVVNLLSEHICRVHGSCEITVEEQDRMKDAMKVVCCSGECYQAPRMTGQLCWDAF